MLKKQRSGWAVLAALYYYSIIASFNLLKVPPLFGMLMEEFHLSEGTVGFIVSASSVAALILVFPSAIIARRIGTYRCGLIAITCSVTGCVIGALSPNLPVLLLGRLVEGCGLGMTGVVGSTTISQHFQGKKLGLPMAVWSTWFAVGSALGSLLSSRVGYGFGTWRASWWTGAALAAAGFVIFALFVRENRADAPAPRRSGQGMGRSEFRLGIQNLRIWYIALFFAALLVCCVGYLAFTTEYFQQVYGMDAASAGALTSLGYWFTLVGGVAAGVVSRLRRSNSMKGQLVQLLLCAVCDIAVFPFGFLVPRQAIVPFLFACGLLNGYTCGVVFGTVPRLAAKPQVIGVSMGIIFTCQNISSFSASPLVGACVSGGNWHGAVLPLLCVTLFGLLCAAAAVLCCKRHGDLDDRPAQPEPSRERP